MTLPRMALRGIAAAGLLGVAVHAGLIEAGAALAAARNINVNTAREAEQAGNWSQAVADWQELYLRGERDPPSELCRLYFDGRPATFDPARITDWCRRAAASGDVAARYRMGLLYLIGLGVDRDAEQAQAFCAAAARKAEPDAPAGFCLAAIAVQNDQAARDALQPPRARPGLSVSDGRGTTGPSCGEAFAAPVFDAAKAEAACRTAAQAGDAEALHRVGLMKLLGVGARRDLTGAAADCTAAEAKSRGRVSAAFCRAAVARLDEAAASLGASVRTGALDAHPETGLALPRTTDDPYAADRALDAPRKTATGLDYTCRRISLWALYEAPGYTVLNSRDKLFGRAIVAYRPADFAALDEAAASCANTIAPLDPRGSVTQTFAEFRRSLEVLKERQAALLNEQHQKREALALAAQVDRAYGSRRFVGPATLTAQESACIERVRRAWQASGQDKVRRSLEIDTSRLVTEGGRFVAYGRANVVSLESDGRPVVAGSTFSCTFDQGTSQRVASFALQPGFSARP